MIDAKKLLTDLQALQKKLEADLRQQTAEVPELNQRQTAAYAAARAAGRTADTFSEWQSNEITQAAVAWLLATTFIRFSEDNGLLTAPMLAGEGDALRRAKDAFSEFVRQNPLQNERHYLEQCFAQMANIPVVAGLYDPAHNPLFGMPLSYEGARLVVGFWQKVNPDSGRLVHEFRDSTLNTRFLGDLYQDLSAEARSRFALLQTPEFVEEFILDRTLEPAIKTFGLKGIRMIDPTCGSGHFVLGAFQRLLTHWRREAPGLDARQHVIEALSGVYGVDLNPFATAIARFRLLVAAMQTSGIRTLREAPAWTFNLTTGDSLLHGRRFNELDLGADVVGDEYAHAYAAEDLGEINRILGQQYHAVVGNPPYITVKDAALNALYRARYSTCHRQYSLGVPFTERFIQLALPPTQQRHAGYAGLITTNSFMKREFGKKLIEEYLPRQDLSHVISTDGAYIPGHGTPTVILFARHRPPVANTVRAVLGIRGEPGTPDDPARGKVWTSIMDLLEQPGNRNDFVSVSDTPREALGNHPWSMSGGGASDLISEIESVSTTTLGAISTAIGRVMHTGCDPAYFRPHRATERLSVSPAAIEPVVVGDVIRDWGFSVDTFSLFPYERVSGDFSPTLEDPLLARELWKFKSYLVRRREPNGTHEEIGLTWYEWSRFQKDRYSVPLSITFAFVATHNHFVLDRGGKVFKQSAPVIKLPAGADESTHLGLVGLLNSSMACFWMKQVFHNKGSTVDSKGARQTTVEFENFYEFTGTGMQRFPLPDSRPLTLATRLDQLAQARAAALPSALVAQRLPTRTSLDDAHRQADLLLAQMIATQEELDWWCYRAYGLFDDDLAYAGTPPALALGERAFEIVMARRMAADELETTWFARHGSTPITALPTHWPADYAVLVQRRIALIESHPWIGLLEKPEYKRRWNQAPWDELEQAALKNWLLDRLEAPAYWQDAAMRSLADLASAAEHDADFMAVAALYTAEPGFNVSALIRKVVADESVPALKVLRYKESGLRKRADWEHTWQQQRREDAIDAEVARDEPRGENESEELWQARIKPAQDTRKREELGELVAPPKYASADFLNTTLWRLRGGLDVPKERFFTVPNPEHVGDWLYGWAGWNPAQRVRALAAATLHAEQSMSGVDPEQLTPLLLAVQEELPWVLQWHNEIDPELDVRPGDYFREWLAAQMNQKGLTPGSLDAWRPTATARRGRGRRQTA